MSTVTQRIPNFLLGISQQPDNRKFPGQVNDAVNTFPDYALGMLKRPGGKYISNLYGATARGKWFSILRDENEKYAVQYDDTDFTFRVWSILDGSPRKVNMGSNTGVPGGCNQTNFQTDTLAYNTAVADTKAKKDLLNTAQATYAETLAGQDTTEVSLFETEYDYNLTSGEVVEALKSGILQTEIGNTYTTKKNGAVIGTPGGSLPAGYALGNERTTEHPLLGKLGYKVFEAVETVAATHNNSQLTAATTAMATAQTNYNNAVTAEATAKTNYDGEVTNCNISAIPSNGYLKDATAADIELLTLADYTFVLNKKKTVAMTSNTTAALANQAFVVINVVAYNSNYKVTVDGTTKTHTTGQTVSAGVVDSSTIVADLTSQINSMSGITATAIGPGIHIVKASGAMTISVSGGSQDDALYAFQDQIADVTRLPIQCADGYKLKITNAADFEADDMWVEFETTNNATSGPGTWIETNAPGITYEFDPLTMPHQLVRQADGSFTFGPVTWADRDIGDDVNSNPNPSFVGNTIRNMFFYRNRFGFLSGEFLVMSKAKSFFNFWNGSAATAAANDPIDISASSTKPIFLNYVRNSAAGLVLFSDNEQFLLSTDSDVLSPTSAKINAVSSYESDNKIQAVNLGTSIAFVSKTPLWTRLFELFEISTTTPPYMFDQTKIVPELIPSTIDNVVASAGQGLVSFGQTGSSTLYQYRFYQLGEKRAASTWYKWDLTGTLLDQFFDVSTFYTVVADGSNVYVESIDLTQASDTGFLTLPTGEKTDVCMDLFDVNPYRTYDSTTDKTKLYLPFTHVSGKTLAVTALGGLIGASNVGGVGAILYPTVAGSAPNQYVEIDGDYRGLNVIIGYIYEMKLDVPRLYPTQKEGEEGIKADYTSNLIIHRVKVSTGLSGPVTYNVNLTGIPNRTQTVSVNRPNQYILNNVNITADAVHDVPIYQRNENISLSIVGDTPLPVSLLGMNWEGRYTDKFYSRG